MNTQMRHYDMIFDIHDSARYYDHLGVYLKNIHLRRCKIGRVKDKTNA